MIAVVVVADTGAALRRLSETLDELPDVRIVRYCSGGAPVGRTLAAVDPDVVLLDELRWPRMTVQRVEEITEHARARTIVCAARLEAGWLAEALRAGAAAIVPRSAGSATLQVVIREVLEETPGALTRQEAEAA